MRAITRCSLLALPALLGPAGCESPAAPLPDPPLAAIVSVEVDSADGPIFRTLVVRLDGAAPIRAEYRTAGQPGLRVRAAAADTLHRLFLPRLLAGRSYEFEVRVVHGANELGTPAGGEFATSTLPDSLALLDFTTTGAPTLPITVLEVWFSQLNWRGLVALDPDGEIVWYWKSAKNLGGFRRRANGNYVINDGDEIIELTPSRDTVRVLPRNGPYGEIHHDLEVTPHNTVLFLARDARQIEDRTIVGEAIWEWSPDTGGLLRRWSSWDHFTWPADSGRASAPANWFHANSLALGARGNVIVSARNMDEVFSIAPSFSAIEWRAGGPNPTLQIAAEDRFYSQHSAIEVADGRIAVFDNGLDRPVGTFSRVLELAVDPVGGIATSVGEFRPTPDNFAIRVGSVRRLANGHTVAAFGWGDPDPVEVYELDEALNVVWRLVANTALQRAYRGTPWADVGGEVEIP